VLREPKTGGKNGVLLLGRLLQRGPAAPTEVELKPEQTVGNEIDFGRLVTGKNNDRQRLQKTKFKRDA
jgi:hypothetical protein